MANAPSYHIDPHGAALSPTLNQEEVGRSRFCGVRDYYDRVDDYVTTSRFGKFFHLAGSGHVGFYLENP